MGRGKMYQLKTKPMMNLLQSILVILVVAVVAVSAFNEEDKEFLELHNKARKEAGVPPLSYDQKLVGHAHKHAKSHAKDCVLKHSDGPYGENLFLGNYHKIYKWKPKHALQGWLNEQKYYNNKTNTCERGKDCGHYTQLIWRDTTKVGCAITYCDNKDTYMVCEYSPPGNFKGLSPFEKHDPFIYSNSKS